MRRISGAILICGVILVCSVIEAQEPFEHRDVSAEAQTQINQPKESAIDYSRYIESGEKAARDKHVRQQFERVLNSRLKSPLQFEDLPFNEIVAQLSTEYNIPIMFDTVMMDALGISPETEVTCNLRGVTFEQALHHIFRQPGLEDLTYIIDEGVLLITTEETACGLSTQVYRVDDLVDKYDLAVPQKPYNSLVEVITATVAYDSWMANGSGEGEIRLMRPGLLIVSQSQYVHAQIQDLLGLVRMTVAEIEKPTESAEATAATQHAFQF